MEGRSRRHTGKATITATPRVDKAWRSECCHFGGGTGWLKRKGRDTPGWNVRVPRFSNRFRQDRHMDSATTEHRKGGRPHKGPRQYLATRIPVADADRAHEAAAAAGLTISDYLAQLLRESFDRSRSTAA